MEEKHYRQTKQPINSSLTVVQDDLYRWGAIDADGNTVIPFGKYAWIDGFQNGLAKVISHKDTTGPMFVSTVNLETGETDDAKIAAQGIINEAGEEVLPLEYSVWKFYGKNFPTIKYTGKGSTITVSFEALNPDLIADDEPDDYYEDDYGSHYGEYAGTYAQDVAGYSDDVINDAFDGDPDAYWNID